ncbi:hypothetical protein BDV27DRAFT_149021 [Aspergillus caelatus]|uniref:Uncharacterized protein n=1 Tax=Aspergillus caelatus TaxID=61420 RepID=A0A5N6ZR87_9EURO|nr:uncharacterized protein BDV27DRAFT_149021 [Aspergillus caelatus]KAE8360084.1 hypothetical protein BDV27DRAFT_149021 [Aspergillus caelatus]
MTRCLSFIFLLLLFGNSVFTAVIPDTSSLEDGSGSLDTRATDADLSASKRDDIDSMDPLLSDTIEARTPAQCRQVRGTGIDSCKKGVQSGVANCKKKIQDDIAKCKNDARGEARCEAFLRPKLMNQCESRRTQMLLCEKARPKVLICCEGMQPQFQALCAIPSFPVSTVRSRLEDAQQQCMKERTI